MDDSARHSDDSDALQSAVDDVSNLAVLEVMKNQNQDDRLDLEHDLAGIDVVQHFGPTPLTKRSDIRPQDPFTQSEQAQLHQSLALERDLDKRIALVNAKWQKLEQEIKSATCSSDKKKSY